MASQMNSPVLPRWRRAPLLGLVSLFGAVWGGLLGVLFATPAQAQDVPPPSPVEADIQRYWGERREVGVVQKRLFPKAGRHELSVVIGVLPSDPFLTYLGFDARYAYYFNEEFGIEGRFSYDLNFDGDLRKFLKENDSNVNAQLLDRQKFRFAANFLWVPLHGKLAVRSVRLAHFDGYLLAGFGGVMTETDPPDNQSGIRPEGSVGAGVKLYFAKNQALRIEYQHHFYPRLQRNDGTGGGVNTPAEIMLGYSYFFGAGRAN
jgi:outer membrane beta-barrel protein